MTFNLKSVHPDEVYESHFKEYIAHGSLVNSKRAECGVKGVMPTCIEKMYGCEFEDNRGKKYIDYVCGLGVNWFGYGNNDIAEAIHTQAKRGVLGSVGTRMELECAKTLKDIFPHLDKMRFLKSGSDGCSAAITIARAFSGKKHIYSEGYHGWHSEFTQMTPPAYGCPISPFMRKLVSLDQIYFDTAAVIIEPVITDISQERIDWVRKLRDKCDEFKVILIFDETITAYRFPKYSFAKYYGIRPDISIQGKALGNGAALSVVGGRKDIMEADYFVSTTFAGETLALASVLKGIELLKKDFNPENIWIRGREFKNEFNSISPKIQIKGYPTRGIFKYSSDIFWALFLQECSEMGIHFGASWFYNFHLDFKKDQVLDSVKKVIAKIEEGKVKLKGKMPQKPFASKARKVKNVS